MHGAVAEERATCHQGRSGEEGMPRGSTKGGMERGGRVHCAVAEDRIRVQEEGGDERIGFPLTAIPARNGRGARGVGDEPVREVAC